MISDILYNRLLKLPRVNLINLMWAALDEMEAYNRRSKIYCIMEAMEAECIDSEEGTKWKIPSLPKMKKATDQMGL